MIKGWGAAEVHHCEKAVTGTGMSCAVPFAREALCSNRRRLSAEPSRRYLCERSRDALAYTSRRISAPKTPTPRTPLQHNIWYRGRRDGQATARVTSGCPPMIYGMLHTSKRPPKRSCKEIESDLSYANTTISTYWLYSMRPHPAM
jgi:hypothetical protein